MLPRLTARLGNESYDKMEKEKKEEKVAKATIQKEKTLTNIKKKKLQTTITEKLSELPDNKRKIGSKN